MKIGITVTCPTCKRTKAPHGRSASFMINYCDDNSCPDYRKAPEPGCLWTGETEEDFGYPICSHGTRELVEVSLGDEERK